MNEIVIYQGDDNNIQIEVQFDKDTVWLTQQQMSVLFGQTKQNISLHISNCFKERELEELSTVKESLTVQNEGGRSVKRKVQYYNLDVIISVGYRVKSQRGTQFRIWATQKLKEVLVKGIVINLKRLDELQQIVQLIQKIYWRRNKSKRSQRVTLNHQPIHTKFCIAQSVQHQCQNRNSL